MKEEILKIFTNRMFHVYCPSSKVEEYEVVNLARCVYRMTNIFMKELETLDKTVE